jgi:predicted permease
VRARFIAIARDVRNTVRIWRLNPGSTFAAYLALTISIGATTSLFSVLNSLLIRPLPILDAEHVMRLTPQISLPDALDLKKRLHSADSFAFYREINGNLAASGEGQAARPVVVHVLEMDADLFRVMGVRMAQGRPFGRDANQPGHACEAVISWPFWKSRFNGEPLAGRTLRLNERPCQVDGVLPEKLDLPVDTEMWIAKPIDLANLASGRGFRSWYGIAHLKNGSSEATFVAELANLASELSRENSPIDAGMKLEAKRLRDWLNHDVEQSVVILFAAVTGVLLMACVNVANLLLARAGARMREISVRVAVGASRASLFQQLLTESFLLALVSSVSGLALSFFLVSWIRNLPNLNLPRPEAITVDWRVMLFALLAAGVTGILFGALPALKVSLTSITGVLSQAGGRISESRRQQLTRKILVVTETALATMLLIVSLLLLRSFREVSRIDLGFQPDHLLTGYISLNPMRYRYTIDSANFARKVLEQLEHKPGIVAATFATSIPLQGVTSGSGPVQIEGRPLPAQAIDSTLVMNTGVSPSFRRTLHIPLLAGADLEERDDREEATSILVNATFAKTFFPSENAVGKRLRYSPSVNPNAPWQTIAGVLGDTRQAGPEAVVRPEIYRPLARTASPFPGIIIRTADNPLSHLRDIEAAVRAADAELPLFHVRTMEQVETRRLGSRSFLTTLLAGFAGVALLLASGGIFAVVAYSVSQRTSEMGVRVACGATHGHVLRLIVRQGLMPALIGIGIGLSAALALSRYLANLLYGVQATDFTSYAGTAVLLAVCSGWAALLPARRAARLEPWRALRYE